MESTRLTSRQADVLRLAADGLTDRGIARRLGMALPTVNSAMSRTLEALDAQNRTHAVAIALRNGWIE